MRAFRDGEVLILDFEAVGDGKAAMFGSPVQRRSAIEALTACDEDVAAVCLVLGQRKPFAAADLDAFGTDADRDIRALCSMFEGFARPVLAVLKGRVAGPAADLALAAHLRIMESDARFAFPALELGLLPGAGSAQRMARLIGAAETFRIATQSKPVSAAEALALGLVDHVLEQGHEDGSVAQTLALWRSGALVGQPTSVRDAGLADGRAYLAAVTTAKATVGGMADLVSYRALVDTVEAVLLLPADQAADLDGLLYEEIAASDEALALTHLRKAELRAGEVPDALAELRADPVRNPGVCGADPALAGLVLTAVARGRTVTVYDPDRPQLVKFLETIASRQEAAVQQGRLTPEQRDSDWARLVATQDPEALEVCDLILAAPTAPVPPMKRGRPMLVVGRGAVPEGAFRLTLTGRIGELALPPSAPGQVARQAHAFLTAMGVTVLLTGQQTPVGVAGRLSAVGGATLRRMVELGVSPAEITSALTAFGLPAPRLQPVEGIAPRAMAQDEILWRWLSALANEGARLLSAGVLATPSEIDLVAVSGLGFPRLRGGPLYQADRRGLMILRRDLMLWAAEGEMWKPVPALDALVSVGRGFAGAVRPV